MNYSMIYAGAILGLFISLVFRVFGSGMTVIVSIFYLVFLLFLVSQWMLHLKLESLERDISVWKVFCSPNKDGVISIRKGVKKEVV